MGNIGKPFTKTWISHQDLVNGAKIVTERSPMPNTRTVTGDDLPYSAKTELMPKR